MTENKRFTIDVETENYENAYFENDKFLCYEDDYDAILKRLNELAEEKEICKQAYREIKEDAIRKTEENKELRGKSSSWKITANEEISEKQELMKQIVKLKEENEILSDELEQAKAVIHKKWNEYLKKKME